MTKRIIHRNANGFISGTSKYTNEPAKEGYGLTIIGICAMLIIALPYLLR
jgi:hypothetical protein